MECAVEGCDRPKSGRGLCKAHYMEWWKFGKHNDIQVLTKAPEGTGCIDSNGYVKVMVNGKATYEHIVLAEKALGRKLPAGVRVHHTGKRSDNHGFCKLVICPHEGYHQLIHHRMRMLGYENNKD